MLRRALTTIRLRLRALLRRRQLDQDLDDEMAFHLALREEQQRASGLDAGNARAAAEKRFGNVLALKEACRDLWTFRPLEHLVQDARYALRMLRRDLGFTTVSVLTLALGIGATTAVFALLDATLLRPLPVPHPERLVVPDWIARTTGTSAAESLPCGGPGDCNLPFSLYERLRDETQSFSGFGAFGGRKAVQVEFRGRTTLAEARFVSGNFLSVLGARASQGRALVAGDDRGAGEPVVTLSDPYWQQRFGADPLVVGQTIVVNGSPLTVVGVMAAGFLGINPEKAPAMWIPLHTAAHLTATSTFENPTHLLDDQALVLGSVARLRPGIPMEAARTELRERFRRLIEDGSTVFDPRKGADVALVSAERGMSSFQLGYGAAFHLLSRLVVLGLAVACANIACLLLARSVARRREIAVRLAIGAGRRRLLTQLLTEGLVLSLLGATAGLALGFWGSRLIALALTPDMQREALSWTHPSAALIGLTTAVVSLTTLVFALVPAWAAWRVEPASALQPARAVGRGTRLAGKGASRMAQWIVAAEVAGTLVLLVGAGLFVRTVIRFVTYDPGFRTDHLLTVGISPVIGKAETAAVSADIAALQTRLSHLGGVESVTWSSLPTLGAVTFVPVSFGDTQRIESVASFLVGPHFFSTMGMKLIAGRDVEASECHEGAPTVWINSSLARLHFNGSRSVGARIRLLDGSDLVVAGIVADTSLGSIQMRRQSAMYQPARADARYFMLRTQVPPLGLAAIAEAAAHDAAPHLLVQSIEDGTERLRGEAAVQRLLAEASLALGGLTLLLAAVGLYGVLSYSVSRRTGEIAIRMSLGAVRADVLRLILGEGSRVVLAGAALGAVGAYCAARGFDHFLFGVRPLDPLTYAAATLLLLAVAALAAYIPASRASRVDPAVALRAE
jgi:predicted permease